MKFLLLTIDLKKYFQERIEDLSKIIYPILNKQYKNLQYNNQSRLITFEQLYTLHTLWHTRFKKFVPGKQNMNSANIRMTLYVET